MPKLDLNAIEETSRTTYPLPFAADMAKRHVRKLAAAGGLTEFGVSRVRLEPGGISSQRHWLSARSPRTSTCMERCAFRAACSS